MTRKSPNDLTYIYFRIPVMHVMTSTILDDVRQKFQTHLSRGDLDPFVSADETMHMYKVPVYSQDDINYITSRMWASHCTAVWYSNNATHMQERVDWIEAQQGDDDDTPDMGGSVTIRRR